MTATATTIAFNRFGLGARPHDEIRGDPRAWVLGQMQRFAVRPPSLDAIPGTAQAIGTLADALAARREARQDAKQASATDAPPPADAKASPKPGFFRDIRESYIAAVGARTNTALVSDTPFAERLVSFWSNHFALSIEKGEIAGLAGAFEAEAIRPHVLGRFGDMLLAVERHPAMLLYLDQAQSIGPDSMAGQRIAANGKRKAGLNENLAREILELHTLGVRTGYAQADVTEFARALTGWTVAGLRAAPALEGLPAGFAFAERFHEPGARQVIGKRYGEGGEGQARAILADLAVHPATARHIATKLARHFAADDPPPALVARLEQAFLRSGGDLPTVYRALVEAPEPWAASPAKFRDPWDWGVAALRASGVETLPARMAANLFQQLGQPIWRPGSPAGYDDITASWAAPDALLRRVEAAGRIGEKAGAVDARALAGQLFPDSLSQATADAIAGAENPGQALALLLVSPEMMRR